MRLQVYLILDEFILGGEIQESSKRVILERLAGGRFGEENGGSDVMLSVILLREMQSSEVLMPCVYCAELDKIET